MTLCGDMLFTDGTNRLLVQSSCGCFLYLFVIHVDRFKHSLNYIRPMGRHRECQTLKNISHEKIHH